MAPDGVEWRVSRRWVSRRPTLNRPGRREVASDSLGELGSGLSEIAGDGEGLVVAIAVVAVVLILIPVLFFGLELVILGMLLAAGVIGRTVLRQPWVIEARSSDTPRALEWRVQGWRKSGKLIDQVASDVSAGRDPSQRSVPR